MVNRRLEEEEEEDWRISWMAFARVDSTTEI
jgi:hypothetical protein